MSTEQQSSHKNVEGPDHILDLTITQWYDKEHTDDERIKTRNEIANYTLNTYIQNLKQGEAMPKPETLGVILESLELVEKLREITVTDNASFDPKIEVVLVLTGPGLFLSKNKPNDQYTQNTYRWLNRDRVLGGMAYARRVAIEKKVAAEGTSVDKQNLTWEDLEKYGPVIFFNGTVAENEELNLILQNWDKYGWDESFVDEYPIIKHFPYPTKLPYPPSKIKISSRPTRHTGEQFTNLAQEIGPDGIIAGAKNISIVSNVLDFIRIGNYAQKLVSHDTALTNGLSFWAYPLRVRRSDNRGNSDTVPEYAKNELIRLATYYQIDHLAEHPYPFKNLARKEIHL